MGLLCVVGIHVSLLEKYVIEFTKSHFTGGSVAPNQQCHFLKKLESELGITVNSGQPGDFETL